MNILHTETLKKWGGQQNRVLAETAGLKAKGHHIVIACNAGSMLAIKARERGIRVYELDMDKGTYFKTVPQIVKIIRKEKIEIVSTHSSVDSWAGGIAALLTGTKLVRFRHNLYPPGKGPLARLIYAIPDRIIAISETVRDVLVKDGHRKAKMFVIHSAVDTTRFDPLTGNIKGELNIPTDALIIGNTSTFTKVKGQEYLLRSFGMIHDSVPCYLLLAGRLSESSRDRYLSEVRKDLREKVILLGHRDDIPRILNTIDVYVYPSYLEGLGTALLEAMTMGRAVAVSDIATFREFVEDGVNGVFFRAKSPEDIAEKVTGLLQNKELRDRIGSNARSAALEKFTVEKMIDLTETLYREVLGAA